MEMFVFLEYASYLDKRDLRQIRLASLRYFGQAQEELLKRRAVSREAI